MGFLGKISIFQSDYFMAKLAKKIQNAVQSGQIIIMIKLKQRGR